jgi:hypothetical protein
MSNTTAAPAPAAPDEDVFHSGTLVIMLIFVFISFRGCWAFLKMKRRDQRAFLKVAKGLAEPLIASDPKFVPVLADFTFDCHSSKPLAASLYASALLAFFMVFFDPEFSEFAQHTFPGIPNFLLLYCVSLLTILPFLMTGEPAPYTVLNAVIHRLPCPPPPAVLNANVPQRFLHGPHISDKVLRGMKSNRRWGWFKQGWALALLSGSVPLYLSQKFPFRLSDPKPPLIFTVTVLVVACFVRTIYRGCQDKPSTFEQMEGYRHEHYRQLLKRKRGRRRQRQESGGETMTMTPAAAAEKAPAAAAEKTPAAAAEKPPAAAAHPAQQHFELVGLLRPYCASLAESEIHRIATSTSKLIADAGEREQAKKETSTLKACSNECCFGERSTTKLDSIKSLPTIVWATILVSLIILVYLYSSALSFCFTVGEKSGQVSDKLNFGIRAIKTVETTMPQLRELVYSLPVLLNASKVALSQWQTPMDQLSGTVHDIKLNFNLSTRESVIIDNAMSALSSTTSAFTSVTSSATRAFDLAESALPVAWIKQKLANQTIPNFFPDTSALTEAAMTSKLQSVQNVLEILLSVSDALFLYVPLAGGIGFTVSLLVSTFLSIRLSWVFRKRVKNIREGNFKWTATGKSSAKLMTATKFTGIQCGTIAAGYVMISLSLIVFITPLCLQAFWAWLATPTMVSLITTVLFAAAFQIGLDRLVGNVYMTDQFWVKRPRAWAWFSSMLMIISVFSGLFFAVKRFVFLAAISMGSLMTLEFSIFPEALQDMDTGFQSFQSMAMLCLRHQSPMSSFFRRWGAEVRDRRRDMGMEMQMQEVPAGSGVGGSGSRGLRSRKAQQKWHMALTLINNPDLIHEHLQKPRAAAKDKRRKIQQVTDIALEGAYMALEMG